MPDRVEEATNYIKKLKINLEKMKEKKKFLLEIQRQKKLMLLKSPKIEIQQIGLTLEVVLITGLNSQFLMNETIRILNEEGVDIVNASYKVNEDTVFHSIHCQVQEEFGNESARIAERLNKLMHDY
ncbi:transcription factor bHLH162-like isoform X2 [Vicia villosa]|nr:transcription factor bHLH162-like isoform X2 [Vicia villosa]